MEGEESREDYDVTNTGDDMSEYRSRSAQELRQQMLTDKVRQFYDHLQITPYYIDPNDFEMENNHLFMKGDKGRVQVTKKANSSQFININTVRGRLSLEEQIRFSVIDTKKEQRQEAIAALQDRVQQTEGEAFSLQDLRPTEQRQEGEQEGENVLNDDDEETSLKTLNASPLEMRELRALDERLRSIRGELENNLAKLSEIDREIEKEKQKLGVAEEMDKYLKNRIQNRLRDLEIERSSRLEVISNNREQLRTQVNRIRETIRRVLYENTTLAERIKTLFREQGITIASVITAIGMTISTLVYALRGGPPPPTSSTPAPTPPTSNWVKKQLDHLKDLLKKLADKAIDALPGILGSVISWILSTGSKVVGYMANHLWTLLVVIAGLLFSKI